MLSIIVPTYNEGPWLKRTLKAIAKVPPDSPYEIIVVDDCSTTEDVLAAERTCSGTKFIHHATRKGTSGGRITGAAAAKGDMLCFLDAHVWPSPGFFDYLIETVSSKPNRIAAPGLTQFKLTKPMNPLPDPPRGTNYGGGFTFACRKCWFYMSVNKKRKHWQRRHGAYACGMTMTRKLYDKLGGWMTLPGYWSSSDVAMCIKAWLLDIPIIIETRAHHFHGVKGFGPHETPKWHEVINRLYAARILFGEDTYNDFWLPQLMSRFGRHWRPEWEKILSSDEVEAQHHHVHENAVKTDAEFMEKFVLPRLSKAGLSYYV